MRITYSAEEWDDIEKFVENRATEKTYGCSWFNSEDEFHDWAGDVFWDLLARVLEFLGIEPEEGE